VKSALFTWGEGKNKGTRWNQKSVERSNQECLHVETEIKLEQKAKRELKVKWGKADSSHTTYMTVWQRKAGKRGGPKKKKGYSKEGVRSEPKGNSSTWEH